MKPPLKPDEWSRLWSRTGSLKRTDTRGGKRADEQEIPLCGVWSAAKSDILGDTHYIKRRRDVKWSFPWIRPNRHPAGRTFHHLVIHMPKPSFSRTDISLILSFTKWKRRGSWSHKVLSNFLLELLELNPGFLFCFRKILCSLRHPSIYSNKSSSPQELPLYTTSYDIYSCSSL